MSEREERDTSVKWSRVAGHGRDAGGGAVKVCSDLRAEIFSVKNA